MNSEFLAYCDSLSDDIKSSYEQGVTIEEAEKLAGKFLHAQITLSSHLQVSDLDRRMRKRGVKAIRSAVRMEEVRKHNKKPTEGHLEDIVNLDKLVSDEEEAFDKAEVYTELLENYLNTFRDAHIFFRGISKGRYE